MMNINRGDKFDYLVAMSTPEMGLTKWREDHEPKDSPTWSEKYVTGDLSVSLIKTAKGTGRMRYLSRKEVLGTFACREGAWRRLGEGPA